MDNRVWVVSYSTYGVGPVTRVCSSRERAYDLAEYLWSTRCIVPKIKECEME